MADLKVLVRIGVHSMSQAAVVHVTRAMALEGRRHGVDGNAIRPGCIETGLNARHGDTDAGRRRVSMLTSRRVGGPRDLDGLLLLALDHSGFVDGSVIAADDGFGV